MEVSKAKTQQVQQTQALLKRNDEAKKNESSDSAAAKLLENRKAEQNKPVINSQGQTTGRLLNATA